MPLMITVGVVIVAITLYLMLSRRPVPLAAWLTYLLMP